MKINKLIVLVNFVFFATNVIADVALDSEIQQAIDLNNSIIIDSQNLLNKANAFDVQLNSIKTNALGQKFPSACAICPVTPLPDGGGGGIPTPTGTDIFYISPTGNDANDCKTSVTPCLTFAKSFSLMVAGNELLLMDGTYNNSTGGIHWDASTYPNSKQPPSGVSLSNPTVIRAVNPGSVKINIPLHIGRKLRKDSYISVSGISFNGGTLYNTSYITIKNVGFSNRFVNGTREHQNGNSFNLIEDVWITASQRRIISLNMRADNSVWRRVLIRGDGCSLANCAGSGNPTVGLSAYDSKNVSFQNVFIVDRILNGGRSYADFATAQHDRAGHPLGYIEWLGSASINSEDNAMNLEADKVINGAPTFTIKDFLVMNGQRGGILIGKQNWISATPNVLNNITMMLDPTSPTVVDGLRLAPGQSISTVNNVISSGAGRYGINSSSPYTNMASHKSKGAPYYRPTSGCAVCLKVVNEFVAVNPLQSSSGSVVGATILNKIGADGSRYGDTNFNAETANSLWPWPNEDRIKNEMCASVTRGFCSATTLTTYIWEFTGTTIPASVYGN